jgi:hypothetical protein
LQQQAGNAAVARLVQRLQDPDLQRESLPEDEEEEDVQAKHDPAIQREGEDEEEMVMGAHDRGATGGTVGLEGGALPDDMAGRIDGLRGIGSTLNDGVRAAAEPALGFDLSGIRVHQDSTSDSLARGMTAKAFTSGTDIFLRSDVSANDSRLMSHELAHVAQQAGGDVAPAGQRMTVGAADDPLEHEADNVADAVASGATANRDVEEQ